MARQALERDGTSVRAPRQSRVNSPVTRDLVLDAALTLFADRGYHGTSLKDLAAAVGIQAPSLYNHIDAKSDLLAEIVSSTLAAVGADFDSAVAAHEDPAERLYAATYVYALRHATYRRETLVVNQDTQHLPVDRRTQSQAIRRFHERRFRQLIVDGADAGVFEVESAKLASFAIREMCVSAARWFREGGEFSADDVARNYASQALRMVGARR